MMEIRNPTFTAEGLIDCEIEHPAFGWIPFTANPDDPELHGREIHARALQMGPAPYVAPQIEAAGTEAPQGLAARVKAFFAGAQ